MKIALIKNVDTSFNYYIENNISFLNKLRTLNKIIETYDERNYILNSKSLITIKSLNYDLKQCCMIILYDDNQENSFKYFDVIDINFVSNQTILNVSLNNFNTYAKDFLISEAFIYNSNKDLFINDATNEYTYLPIEEYADKKFEFEELQCHDNSDRTFWYDIKNISDTNLLNNLQICLNIVKADDINLLGNIKAYTKYSYYTTAYQVLYDNPMVAKSLISDLQQVLSKIYQKDDIKVVLDSEITILPFNVNLSPSPSTENFKAKTKSITGSDTTIVLQNNSNINILNTRLYFRVKNKSIHKDYYFGTYSQNFKIKRKSENFLYLEVIKNNNDYIINIGEDDFKIDVSKSFKLYMNSKAQDLDKYDKMSFALSGIKTAISFIKPNITNMLKSSVDLIQQSSNKLDLSEINTNGDAFSSYYYDDNAQFISDTKEFKYPIMCFSFTSNQSEINRLIYNGVIFNKYYENNNAFSFSEFINKYHFYPCDFLYLKANLKGYGCNTNAINEIILKVQNGIKIKTIEQLN